MLLRVPTTSRFGPFARDPRRRVLPGTPVLAGAHSLLLLPGMRGVIAAIEHDIAAAARRVLVETYIYHDRRFGRRFARRLLAARRRGAQVKLLYDALGSHLASDAFFARLRGQGIETRAYRPLDVVIAQAAPFPRDHSRIVVADGAAYTGGAAWGDHWLPRSLGGSGWYDVCLRIEGPVVEDFARLFHQRWREATGEATPSSFTTADAYPDLELIGDTPAHGSLVEERYRAAARRAKRRVWIESSYFFPGEALLEDLCAAAARGVDVQIIVPGETDLAIVKRAARAEMADWIQRGLHLFAYRPAMMHSKYALVDDDWCTVGSFNMNPTSTEWANEVALFVTAPAFVARVAAQFQADRARSRRIDEAEPDARPSLWERAGDRLAALALRIVDRTGGVLPK